MWIDSSGKIEDINCGFIFRDGSFYGTDEYHQGWRTHERILQYFGIKEEAGVIRFCNSFIMLNNCKYLRVNLPQEYSIDCISKVQSTLLRKWMSKQIGSIMCPTIHHNKYQIRFLESCDDKLLTNIITIK